MTDAGGDFAVLDIDDDGVAGSGLLAQEHLAQRILDLALDGALQWAGTVLDVKAMVCNQVLGGIGDFQLQAILFHTFVEGSQFDIDNLEDAVVVE